MTKVAVKGMVVSYRDSIKIIYTPKDLTTIRVCTHFVWTSRDIDKIYRRRETSIFRIVNRLNFGQ